MTLSQYKYEDYRPVLTFRREESGSRSSCRRFSTPSQNLKGDPLTVAVRNPNPKNGSLCFSSPDHCAHAFPCYDVGGFNKVRGVNLGGWLVVERWIKPSLFDEIPNGDMLDGTQVQLKSVTRKKYVSASNGGGMNVTVDRDIPSWWETFKIHEQFICKPLAALPRPGAAPASSSNPSALIPPRAATAMRIQSVPGGGVAVEGSLGVCVEGIFQHQWDRCQRMNLESREASISESRGQWLRSRKG
ncbi:hypothetical protein KSP40_PGU017021 [Platanthera guangdongensis]|uniref:DUF7910 domain-containing protein n=1 Tax=Platanthera guangdongensis TaxID=2320717 RepID=A0ABR2MZV9_9ASPA